MLVGPTLLVLSLYVESIGVYIQILPEFSFWNATLIKTQRRQWWTIFYWGWWISRSPFVGMFIALISKGRSVREMIIGVIVLPCLLCFLWFAMFGGAAINLQMTGELDVATALFVMLEAFPWTFFVSIVGILLLVSFFVTSSDSGSLVGDHLTSGEKLDSPKPQRVFWACMEGLVACVSLLGGDLSALQTAAVATGLPFLFVLLIMLWSLKKPSTKNSTSCRVTTTKPSSRPSTAVCLRGWEEEVTSHEGEIERIDHRSRGDRTGALRLRHRGSGSACDVGPGRLGLRSHAGRPLS